jgi:hypothetical protein
MIEDLILNHVQLLLLFNKVDHAPIACLRARSLERDSGLAVEVP